jgi:prepilin-type N-terminal cleavage/methylation domain-containing protein
MFMFLEIGSMRHKASMPLDFHRRDTRPILRTVGRGRGFTLLEIVLAVAILAASLAALAEIVRLGVLAAEQTRSVTQAELLASSKLAEIVALGFAPEPVQNAAFDEDPQWSYSISRAESLDPQIVAVTVTAFPTGRADDPAARFSIARWLFVPSSIQSPTGTP